MKLRQLILIPFCPFERMFTNPHHLSGVVACMFLTCVATFVWSLIVLVVPDVLTASGSRYAFVAAYVNEDVLAGLLALVSSFQLYSLWRWRQCHGCHGLGYGVMLLWWGFVFFTQILRNRPIQATACSLSFTLMLAALYAFLDGHYHSASEEPCEHPAH
jgi:hypothetical protein